MSLKQPASDREIVWIVGLALGIAAFAPTLLGLTSAGTAGAAITILICWFFGRYWIAVPVVVTSAIIIVTISHQGLTAPFFTTLLHQYIDAYQSVGWLTTIWLDAFGNRNAWLVCGPIGTALAGGLVLLFVDKRQSRFAALATGRLNPGHARAPISYIAQWWVSRRRASRKARTVLGTEVINGRVVTVSDDHLNKHLLLIGTTGRGKTVTLMNVIQSAIEKVNRSPWSRSTNWSSDRLNRGFFNPSAWASF